MSEDGSFYLVYIQNQSLTPLLYYNTHRMERFDHENLFLYIFSIFPITTDVLPFYRFRR